VSIPDVKSEAASRAKTTAIVRRERIIETARVMLAHNQSADADYVDIYSDVRAAFARATEFENAANKLRRGDDL
jgi:predicted RNA binding protein with dsRBD fold (UPF0201 family)